MRSICIASVDADIAAEYEMRRVHYRPLAIIYGIVERAALDLFFHEAHTSNFWAGAHKLLAIISTLFILLPFALAQLVV